MDYITTKDAAELQGCSQQHIRKQCIDGKIECMTSKNPANGHSMYLIPISSLPDDVQHRYYKQIREDLPSLPVCATETEVKPKKKRILKPLESYSDEERKRIAMWCGILREWQETRISYGWLSEADPLYVAKLQLEHPGLEISVDILYRKYAAYRENDYDGVLGIRGGWNKGRSKIPDCVFDFFLWCWLDDNKTTVANSYIQTVEWCRDYHPDCVDTFPSEHAFRYRIRRDVAEYIQIAAREGKKVSHDKFAPYAFRWYDDLNANDVWIADNHTIDVQCMEDGTETVHRLHLTSFQDAKSGVITCYNITDTVNSQSTLIALRHGFDRYGIPKCIYSDNGREFLTHDIGGMGHRKRKSQEEKFEPPTILAKMGIEFRVAIVKNAQAKPIERTYLTLKNQFSRLFSGFNGGCVAEKKESLKTIIKKGLLPRDSEIRDALTDWIDGIYNCSAYGGAESKYKGMSHIEVWNKSIQDVGVRKASDDELNIMMMRTTRMQKIKRNGVKITLRGQDMWYMNPEETYKRIGQDVYVRYDPADMRFVRIYDDHDRYICSWGLADFLYRDYLDDNPDGIGELMKIKRMVEGKIKHDATEHIKRIPEEHRISALDLMTRRAHRNLDSKFKITMPTNIIPVRANEEPVELKKAAGAENQIVLIDRKKMADNAEKRRKD